MNFADKRMPFDGEELCSSIQTSALMQCMEGGVVIIGIGEDLSVLYVSPSYAALPGAFLSSEAGQEEAVWDSVLCDDREKLKEAIRAGVQADMPIVCDYRINTKGALFHRRARIMPLGDMPQEQRAVLCLIMDNTSAKRVEDELAQGNAQLDIVLERMKAYLWEVDVASAAFRIWDAGSRSYPAELTFSPVPACFTEQNWVYPEFVSEFTLFFSEMLDGKAEGQCACILRQIGGKRFSWVKMSYRMQYDENGKPKKAIGICERFPNILDEKSRFEQEEKLIDTVKDRLIGALKVNITLDSIESIYVRGDSLIDKSDIHSSEDAFKENIRAMINDEDIARYCARMNPAILSSAYERGSDWSMTEYRRKDKFGNVKWVESSCLLITEPVNGDLYAFTYLMDKDYLKRRELALPAHVEIDPATHLYTRKTARALMREILGEKEKSTSLCALMMIDFEGIKGIIERISYSVGSRMIFSLARTLRLLLSKECVIGREDEFRISVFMPSVTSRKRIYEIARELMEDTEHLREHASMREPVEFSVGVAVSTRANADITLMCTQANQACAYALRSKNKHHVHVAEEADAPANAADSSLAKSISEDRPLTQDEYELYAKCLSLLVCSDVYVDALNDVLRILGSYYAADRADVFALSKDCDNIKRAHEWAMPGKESGSERLGRFVPEEMRRIKAVVESGCVCYFDRTGEDADGRCIIAPITENGEITGVLCFDNVSMHLGETALLSAVTPALVAAFAKYRKINARTMEEQRFDRLTGLLDRDACMGFIRKSNPETISTLGVMFVDVNGLSTVNQEMGIDYGDNLIRFAASTVKGEFKLPEVYRYSGDEIIVLCQNLTHEVFTGKCENIKRVYDTVYPGRMSIGCTWADVDINIFKMIDHAVKFAMISKQSYYLSEVHGSKHLQSEALKILMDHLEQKRFEVWFQPKASVFTGEVVGAEALVRLLDPDRGIVSPSEFIPVFERGHAIRELDFFVLDETLRMMQQWKNEGKRIVPVSVNYSRETLLDPIALETTLSIFSRYTIPQNMIEIEITESIGEMEHATIGRACGQFRENGFRLALDDFGSAYSSMAVLANVPFDAVKVDKSIINNIVTNKVSRSIVESTLRICKETGASCVAEGVETEEQAKALLGVGCMQAQGYFYNKPMTAASFAQRCLREEERNESL